MQKDHATNTVCRFLQLCVGLNCSPYFILKHWHMKSLPVETVVHLSSGHTQLFKPCMFCLQERKREEERRRTQELRVVRDEMNGSSDQLNISTSGTRYMALMLT